MTQTGSGYLRFYRHKESRLSPDDLPQQRFDAWWLMWTRANPKASEDEIYRNRRRIAKECGV